MSLTKPISKKELEEIRESVERAVGRIYYEPKVVRDWKTMVAKESKLPPRVCQQNRVLFSLTCSEAPDLRLRRIPSVIETAIKNNDLTFFTELGRVLAERKSKLKEYTKPWDRPVLARLVKFLLSHWANARDGLPELFKLNSQGLADVCSHSLNFDCSTDAVTKWRQRLKLKVFKRNKVHVMLVDGKLKFRNWTNIRRSILSTTSNARSVLLSGSCKEQHQTEQIQHLEQRAAARTARRRSHNPFED